ncbi:pilus assembly FimT family protein [Thiomicrorhabdus indica]|uniref:pilus assembly FimT family protein n=1 Tax=Thiomicrorhabdus indica TaxID=2267253 RepID=UPI00102DD3F2|nr:type II secretion system protein [Thiomicrorhabdus indica]
MEKSVKNCDLNKLESQPPKRLYNYKHKQRGVALMEWAIALGLMGVAATAVISWQKNATDAQMVNDTVQTVVNTATKARSLFGIANDFTGLNTIENWNNAGLVKSPFVWDATNTKILDPWGHDVVVAANTSEFGMQIGGANLGKETCVDLVKGISKFSHQLQVGDSASLASGLTVTADNQVKSVSTDTPNPVAIATGCSETSPVIVFTIK